MAKTLTQTKELTLGFGALSPSIAKQLRAQGIKAPGHMTASVERTRQAIIHLNACGFISDSVAHTARKRLFKVIQKELSR